MTNGNGNIIPGVFVAGGVGISNTAILIGALALGAAMWFGYAGFMKKKSMGDSASMQQEMSDVYAYSAYPAQVSQNADRIRAAIQRARSVFQTARDAFKKKIQDLVAARKAGTITNEQFRDQLRIAIQQFHLDIRTRWQEIHQELGLATANSHVLNIIPTLP